MSLPSGYRPNPDGSGTFQRISDLSGPYGFNGDTNTMYLVGTGGGGGGGGGGDASAANQVTGNASLSSIDTKTPALSGGSVPVVVKGAPSAGASTSVAAATAATQLLAANANRKGATIVNDQGTSGTATLYVLLGTGTVAATLYTSALQAGDYWEVPYGFTGLVTGIWSAANGAARITELS